MANVSGIVKSARNIMRQDTGTGRDELRILQLGLSARVDGCPSTSMSQVNRHDSGSPLNAQPADSEIE